MEEDLIVSWSSAEEYNCAYHATRPRNAPYMSIAVLLTCQELSAMLTLTMCRAKKAIASTASSKATMDPDRFASLMNAVVR